MSKSTHRLSTAEMDKLSVFTHALFEDADEQNEVKRSYAELSGLYFDIINEISRKDVTEASIIFDYAKHLCHELLLYSGTEAYIMGLENRGISADTIVVNYQLAIADERNLIENRIQAAFMEISALLGSSKWLIADFTTIFRLVHGAVKNNLRDFVELGQE